MLCPINYKERIAFTEFHLSNHSLTLETGRHLKLEVYQEMLSLRVNAIETEQHFIFNVKSTVTIEKCFSRKYTPPLCHSIFFLIKEIYHLYEY